mgnify:CR=1 FL=1
MASNSVERIAPGRVALRLALSVRPLALVLWSATVSVDKPSIVVKGSSAGWRICPECGVRLQVRRCPKCKATSVPALLLEGGSVSEPEVGMILGDQYELLEKLGEGGMGKVYRATQLSMDREVAVKIISREISSDLDSIRRFQREAKVTSRLSHPHSIRVFDFGITDEGLFYLAMELLRGRELLEEIIRLGRLPLDRALDIAIQTLTALLEAHEQGIIHRDLKPTNIFLLDVAGEVDYVKVMDFGIAKASFAEEYQKVTQTGMIVGTPKYMSPEQARGLGADARSDIYAVGIMLYEMLVGEAPFEHDSPVQVLLMHISEPTPRLAKSRPELQSLERVQAMVDRLVAKEPGDRPANVAYAASELQALRDSLVGGRQRRPTAIEGDVTAEADVVQLPAAAVELQAEENLAPTSPNEAVREGQIDTAPFAMPAAAAATWGSGPDVLDVDLPEGLKARDGDRATFVGVAIPVPVVPGEEADETEDERQTQAFSVVPSRPEVKAAVMPVRVDENKTPIVLTSQVVPDSAEAKTVALDLDRINAATWRGDDEVRPAVVAPQPARPARWPYVVGGLLLLVAIGAGGVFVANSRAAAVAVPAAVPAGPKMPGVEASAPVPVPAVQPAAPTQPDVSSPADAGPAANGAADAGSEVGAAGLKADAAGQKADVAGLKADAGPSDIAPAVSPQAVAPPRAKKTTKKRRRRRSSAKKRSPYLMD